MDRTTRSAFTRKVKEGTFPKVSPCSVAFVLRGVVWRFAVQYLEPAFSLCRLRGMLNDQ